MKSSQQLKRYLMREVHGLDIPRKPPKMASVLHGNKPARNWRYKAWIRSLPCAACDKTPSEAAHTGTDGGTAQKASDYSCIPLCTEHHTAGPRAYHGLNTSAAEFAKLHDLDIPGLVKRLNRAWFNQWKVGK